MASKSAAIIHYIWRHRGRGFRSWKETSLIQGCLTKVATCMLAFFNKSL